MYLQQAIELSRNRIGQPRFLWFFILAYSMVLMGANWFDPRLIKIFGLETGAGAIIFPITYLLSDLITEIYGYKSARLSIWIGFLFNAIFVLYGEVVALLPGPELNNTTFNSFMHAGLKIIIGGIFSYLITESLNSYLMMKLKIFFSGRYLGIRFILSTLTATAINVVVFCSIAFIGIIESAYHLLHFMFCSWFFMVSVELLLLPFSIRLTQKIKQSEKLDIYDRDTKFNIFGFETHYSVDQNEFKQE